MSPEQALGRKLDHRSDVFSLGSCLYEMLTRIPPFTATNEMDLLIKVRDAKYRPVSELTPGIPPELEAITDKCLTRSRANRYQTAAEVEGDLRAFLRKFMPNYSRSHLGRFIRKMFATEIERELRMLEEYVMTDEVVRRRRREPDGRATRTSSRPRCRSSRSRPRCSIAALRDRATSRATRTSRRCPRSSAHERHPRAPNTMILDAEPRPRPRRSAAEPPTARNAAAAAAARAAASRRRRHRAHAPAVDRAADLRRGSALRADDDHRHRPHAPRSRLARRVDQSRRHVLPRRSEHAAADDGRRAPQPARGTGPRFDSAKRAH